MGMHAPPEQFCRPKFLQNSLLVFVGIVSLAVLSYQLPRWAHGLDPTFVHPKWIAQSPVPFVLKLVTVHPAIWIALVAAAFAKICLNYGWRLRK
jgi:hypothetical protein